LTEESLFGPIDGYHALIKEAVEADDKKLFSYEAFEHGTEALKAFILGRREYLLANQELLQPAPEIVSVEGIVFQDDDGESLTVTATIGGSVPVKDVQLYVAAGPFAVFEPFPMPDDAAYGDGDVADNTFGIVLSNYPAGTTLRYYVQAKANDGVDTVSFYPPGAEYEVYTHVVTYPSATTSPVVLNEVMAKNDAAWADPQDEYDDWIELKNTSSVPLDLAGMYLSDNPDIPLKWQFPAHTVVEPGGYLIVWADEDGGDEPGLHANFKLASAGETIWLFDTFASGHALLDSVTFTDLETDQSCGRSPDGEGPMQVLSAPSPMGPNE